ncbi:MAG: (Fe-S)-binding protein [bacterium]|nr:(Fe-S)-binding protein [bacterium]
MKNLCEYESQIQHCSKCGLCMSVCPVYKVTGNDCAVSRGKFIMLNGVLNCDLKLNENINKYLDMCLMCNACKDFCPVEIDARKILLAAKADYFESKKNMFEKFIFSTTVFENLFKLIGFCLKLYRLFFIPKFVRFFYPILKKNIFGRKIILMNEYVDISNLKREKHEKQIKKAVYFKGCISYINPKTRILAENLLAKIGVNIREVDFKCCGMPMLSSGDIEQFKKRIEYNLKNIPDDFDVFLTDCATCKHTIEHYSEYITDKKLLEKLENIKKKSKSVSEYLLENLDVISLDEKISFTYKKPCHETNLNLVDELCSKFKNLDYKQMCNFDSCCGFAGSFALKNMALSENISLQTAENLKSQKTDYAVTTCEACVLGIMQGLIKSGDLKTKPISMIEFISVLTTNHLKNA